MSHYALGSLAHVLHPAALPPLPTKALVQPALPRNRARPAGSRAEGPSAAVRVVELASWLNQPGRSENLTGGRFVLWRKRSGPPSVSRGSYPQSGSWLIALFDGCSSLSKAGATAKEGDERGRKSSA